MIVHVLYAASVG